MRIKLTYTRPAGTSEDIAVDVDLRMPVGELARELLVRDPQGVPPETDTRHTLRVDSRGVPLTLDPGGALADAAIRNGDVVAVVSGEGDFVEVGGEDAEAATLTIRNGPGAGSRFRLRRGATELGRDRSCDIVLPDELVSKRHARVNITDGIEVIDLGSANGMYVGGELVQRVNLRSGEEVQVGDTTLVIEHHHAAAAVEHGNNLLFNRSPVLDPRYGGEAFKVPTPPERPKPQSFPFLVLAAPLLMGVILFAFTQQILSVVFVALSPILMAGTYIQQRQSDKKNYAQAVTDFRDSLAAIDAQITDEQIREVTERGHEHPDPVLVVDAVHRRAPLLWSRRRDRVGFLEVRAGVAGLPSRCTIEVPERNAAAAELWNEVDSLVAAHALVSPVPLAVAFTQVGVVGVAGPGDFPFALARSFIAQIVGLHSPADVSLVALVPAERSALWDWLKWLPHVDGQYSPIEGTNIGVGGAGVLSVASAVRDLIVLRQQAAEDREDGEQTQQVVVVVDDDAPAERSLLVEIAERGPDVGVFVLWVSSRVERVPSRAAVYVADSQIPGRAEAGILDGGRLVVPVDVEPISDVDIINFARVMAPLVDAGAGLDSSGELPVRVSFLGSVGMELATDPEAVIERWRASDSLPWIEGAHQGRRRRVQPLHAFVGETAAANMSLDLRANGPHALVGGTTGAGKSEFLQSWVMGLAVNHSPLRVTFLFVDYKGGAAFSECVRLPHTVGLVTDLTPHLVKRALRSLNAELQFREHVLNRKRAKDVLELEARGDPDCPPSLVIVVDEFAALVTEVPEFVDGVVNVAQRGRSLGLHLILATQRPAGVIRDNLRANTNLRVALRMADEADSEDVVGSAVAAGFDPSRPGRGVVKTGPGRLSPFQSAYVGGWTTDEEPPPPLVIAVNSLASTAVWEPPVPPVEAVAVDPGPNDLSRLVSTTVAAASDAGIDSPRKPWLAELAESYDIARLPQSRVDRELVFGVLDDPDRQAQVGVAFEPDTDGNMAVIGTGGSGKSVFLRTLAVTAGLATRSGPCHVYGLDFGARGLQMLAPLPHVGSVVNGDDEERVARTLKMLRDLIDERATRYAAIQAGSITEYRELAGQPEEPRILLLVDGFAAFRQEYEIGPRMRVFDRFQSIASDGRQVGVHVVLAADRANSIPAALGSMIQRRLVLRLASENDYVMAGVAADALAGAPPGRGFLDDHEVQVAVLGGSQNTATQAGAIQALASEMEASLSREPAAEIGRLPDLVRLGSLPVTTESGGLVIGIADEDLGPAGMSLDDPIYVAGPPRSGKTTTVITIALALRRRDPAIRLVYIGDGRSALTSGVPFDDVLITDETLEDRLFDLTAELKDAVAGSIGIFFDDAPRLSTLDEDPRLVDLYQLAARSGQTVVAEGETGETINSSWGLMKVIRVARHGIALIPDQFDGDSIFKTPFPPINRRDYPPGRGIYVRSGHIARVQVALPDLEDEAE